eukprot:scaffold12448_cov138-Alexandrium_tamarense.AAC.1
MSREETKGLKFEAGRQSWGNVNDHDHVSSFPRCPNIEARFYAHDSFVQRQELSVLDVKTIKAHCNLNRWKMILLMILLMIVEKNALHRVRASRMNPRKKRRR